MLTRLPSGLAVAPALAADVLSRRFSGSPLQLDNTQRDTVLRALATAGVFGGAAQDGLIALEAKAHGETLLTLDERAQVTYRSLGAGFSVITG